MLARCCTNAKCKITSPYHTCPMCRAPTEALPVLDLGAIGLKAKAALLYNSQDGYQLRIDKLSGSVYIEIKIHDLEYLHQPALPHLEPATTLEIMDITKDAATLIAQKKPLVWPGWILYLIESLEAHTDEQNYQNVLRVILKDLAAKVVEDVIPEA